MAFAILRTLIANLFLMATIKSILFAKQLQDEQKKKTHAHTLTIDRKLKMEQL